MNYVKELENQLYTARGRMMQLQIEVEDLKKRCDELIIENMDLRNKIRAMQGHSDNIFDVQCDYTESKPHPHKKTPDELKEEFAELVKKGILK